MIGFILADLRRLWLGGAVVVLLVALATALGVAVSAAPAPPINSTLLSVPPAAKRS